MNNTDSSSSSSIKNNWGVYELQLPRPSKPLQYPTLTKAETANTTLVVQ